MADDQPNPSQDDAGDGAPIGGMSEAELTDLLSQAGELVEELTTQLGEPDPLVMTVAPDPKAEAPAGDSSLEEELSRLEELVDATSTDVAGADVETPASSATSQTTLPAAEPSIQAAPPTEENDSDTESELEHSFPDGNLPPPIAPEIIEQALSGPMADIPSLDEPVATQWPLEEETTHVGEKGDEEGDVAQPSEVEEQEIRPIEESDTIPDFMKEFLDPEPEEEAKPAETAKPPEVVTQATPMPVQTKPGVVGTGMLHQVVKPTKEAESGVSDETPANATPKAQNPLVRIARRVLVSLLQRCKQIGPVKPLLMRAAYWVCDKAVFVLEKIDKPVSGVGDLIRRVVGWVAVATLGTSAIVYIISLF